jgi:hypothetical protein
MSYRRIDELFERRATLIVNLQTCEGMGWRDEERYNKISAELHNVEKEIEQIKVIK